MLASPLIAALRFGWQGDRHGKDGTLLLGFGVGLLALYIQCLYEWSFFLFYTQYMVAITMGMIAGLAQRIRYRPAKALHSSEVPAAAAVPRNKIWLN